MFEIIKPGTKFDFIGKTRAFAWFSGTLMVLSVVSLFVRTATNGTPLNFGTDFTGGTEIQLAFKTQVPTKEVRKAVKDMGFKSPEVQSIDTGGETFDFLVRIRGRVTLVDKALGEKLEAALAAKADALGKVTKFDPASSGDRIYLRFDKEPDQETLKQVFAGLDLTIHKLEKTGRPEDHTFTVHLQEIQGRMAAQFKKVFGDEFLRVARAHVVGPKAGERLRNDGILAVLVALGAILIYIAVRFDFRFAPGAVVALIHDVTITVGLFSMFWWEFSLTTIAALLTIVGYSLNDTIVIFDRIREAFEHSREKDLSKTTNQALNETLSRTLLTSLTTFLVVLSIFLFGGSLIRTFAIALMIGVVFGTYSSIGIASPTMLWMDKMLPKIQALLGPENKKAAARARSRKKA